MSEKTLDMTEGKPLRLIVSFALPLLLGNICQQLYSVIDSVIVGRNVGVNAFAALGAAGFYYWMIFSIILGFTQGFGTFFAQRFGAKDDAGLKKAIGLSTVLTVILGAALTCICLVFVRPMLVVVNTPPEIIDDACLYLYWVLSSVLVMFAYNTAASLLRALGNSKTPLVAVIIASAVNIVLDLVFVKVFLMGVAGVAIATVIATVCSFVYCLAVLKKTKYLKLSRSDFAIDKELLRELLRLGSPLALRNILISVGGLVVQYMINGFGTFFVAGTSAAGKYFGVMNLVGCALDCAVAVYVGQNYGAGKLPRIKEGMRSAVWIAIASSVAASAVTLLFGREMIGLLITGTPDEIAAVSAIGYDNLIAISVCLPFLYFLFIYRSALQGMGNSTIPMFSGFLETVMRMAAVVFLPSLVGVWGVYFADGLAWIGAAVLLSISYYSVYRSRVNAIAWKSLNSK